MIDIGGILIGLGVFINAIIALITFIQTMRTAKTIDLLEKNTNSVKDALVKVTGESEHAKGMIQGAEEERNKQ